MMNSVHKEILRFISGWDEKVGAESSDFEDLALELFRYQYERNEIYRNFCGAMGVSTRSVRHWLDIPALPVSIFKEFPVTTFPIRHAVAVFQTTGTTRGKKRRGKHYFQSLEFYELAAQKIFRAFCLSRLSPVRRYPFLVAFPPPAVLPHSSLSFMLDLLVQKFGDENSGFFVESRPMWKALAARLQDLAQGTQPVILFGTTLHLADFLGYLKRHHLSFPLPKESLVLDTGGSKIPGRSLDRSLFLRDIRSFLSVSQSFVLNEYGMTEMTSQCYDGVLFIRSRAQPPIPRFLGKLCPPWVRVVLVDPKTLEPRPGLKHGLLKIYDLANVDSVLALQTEDIGTRLRSGAWDVIDRLPDAGPRGCSLAAADFLDQ